MSSNNLKIGLFTLCFLAVFSAVFAQEFASKEHYLVDSLDLKTLNKSDRIIIDSLLNEYHFEKEDSSKLNRLSTLISLCEDDIWVKYNQILKNKAEELSHKYIDEYVYIKQLSSAYNNYGFYFYGQNKIDKAIFNFKKSIVLSKKIDDNEVLPTALNNLGYIYKQQGQILKALAYYYQSLKLNKELNDQEEIALSLNNIGGVYYYLKRYEKALKHYKNALIIEKKEGTEKGVARLHSNIGSVCQKQNKQHLALAYYARSIKNYNKINYARGAALSLSKYAAIELEMLTGNHPKELKLILEKFKKTYNIFDKKEDVEGLANSAYNISTVYMRLGNVSLAKKYANESLFLAKKVGFPASIKSAAKALKEIAVLKKDYRGAYFMQQLFYKMQDSIENDNIKEVVIQKQYQYEYEKKIIKDSLKTAETTKINKIKYKQAIKTQKLYLYIGVIGSVLLLIVVIVVLRGYQIKKNNNLKLTEINKIIEEKNNEITDSITYAKRIQQAILPHSEFKIALKQCVVFYKPKDIVAGDFYWMQQKDDTVLYAAADCTGHGVPGAMVSVVCYNALNRAVKEYGLINPSDILNKTSELVVEAFKQGENDIEDGMDIALCTIDFKKKLLQYSGANNPLYLFREGQLIEIKANKRSVGASYRQERFINHTLNLKRNDCIYTFSDGYADQFGGPKNKKFMLKRFKEMLLSINELSMDMQQQKIEKEFFAWKGGNFQVDDVCVIGVKI